MSTNRRTFIKNVGTTTLVAPLALSNINACQIERSEDQLEIHLFSKHLQFLNWKEAAEVAADIGFTGLDITV